MKTSQLFLNLLSIISMFQYHKKPTHLKTSQVFLNLLSFIFMFQNHKKPTHSKLPNHFKSTFRRVHVSTPYKLRHECSTVLDFRASIPQIAFLHNQKKHHPNCKFKTSPFISLQNAVCFIILTYFGSCIIHILYTGCDKI